MSTDFPENDFLENSCWRTFCLREPLARPTYDSLSSLVRTLLLDLPVVNEVRHSLFGNEVLLRNPNRNVAGALSVTDEREPALTEVEATGIL